MVIVLISFFVVRKFRDDNIVYDIGKDILDFYIYGFRVKSNISSYIRKILVDEFRRV